MSKPLTLNKLKNLLVLRDGEFYWKVDQKRLPMWSKAGSLRKSDGVIQIQIEGKSYLKHRLIHFYQTGKWPGRKKYAARIQRTDGVDPGEEADRESGEP